MKVIKLAYPEGAEVTRALAELSTGGSAKFEIGTALLRAGHRIPEEGESSHGGTEISVVLEGKLDVVADGVLHRLTAGDLVIVPAKEPHHTTVIEEARLVYAFLADAGTHS